MTSKRRGGGGGGVRPVRYVVAKAGAYSCGLCPQLFPYEWMLKVHQHRINESGQRVFFCTSAKLPRSRKRASRDTCYARSSVLLCAARFSTYEMSEAHVVDAHGIGRYHELVSNLEKFKSARKSLECAEAHLVYVCAVCRMKCDSRAQLVQHSTTHITEENSSDDFATTLLPVSATSSAASADAAASDGTVRDDIANFCRMLSRYDGAVAVARIVYQCGLCAEEFADKADLVDHVSAKLNSCRRHVCVLCDYDFAESSSSIREHVRQKHGMKEFMCGICGKEFTTFQGFRDHTTSHQKTDDDDEPYSCIGPLLPRE